ncbi:MAG: DUF1667 domain-containing protein [Coriobacteriales bacterium]|jgi:CxxC motif-containing protein
MPDSARNMSFTCVSCPLGCQLEVLVDGGNVVSVTGNNCNRGVEYARSEATDPKRVVTALVDVRDSQMPASCRTESAISKRLIPQCLKVLRGIELEKPVRIGQVIVENVCDTGVNIIATKDIL